MTTSDRDMEFIKEQAIMELSTNRYKRCDVFKPVGRIDAYAAPTLEEALNAVIDEGRYNIVLEMSEVDFLSSRGLWVLTEANKKCRRYNRGELVLANVIKEIRETLDLAGMGQYFKFFDDLPTAVGSF
jgi:anti-sigma B factor antagonist